MKTESIELARRSVAAWKALRNIVEAVQVEPIDDGLQDYRFCPTPDQEAKIERDRVNIRRALGG